jgi:hypothetical protein
VSAIYPQIIVEVAFPPTDPALMSTDLILDDVTFGLLGTGTLAASDTYTDITAYVQDGTTSRVSTRQQGPLTVYQGGTASFTLNNADGRFDPANLSGPYVAAGVSQVRPMVPVRVRAIYGGVTYSVFSGFATSWIPPAGNFGPVYDQTVLAVSDAFRIFNGVTIPASGAVGAGELSGSRIRRILAAAGWYASARGSSVIAGGNTAVQATTLGDTALNLMQLTADTEIGELYMDGSGRLVFRNRNAILQDTRSNTVQGVFGGVPGTSHSAGTELECTALARPDDDTTLANDIQATRVGGSLQEVQDAVSIATYLFPRTYARSDLLHNNDTDTLNWANYVSYLSADDEFRFDDVTITPGADPAALFPQALGRDLGDRIQVWKRPPGVTAYSKDLFVRGITHTFTPAWWQTVWTTQSAARYSFFVLDNATLGQLDDNALAF